LKPDDIILKQKLEILFREHFAGLCYFAKKYTGDLDSAKEVVHSVFVRLWENRYEFDWNKPGKSYLFTSVYNKSLNYIRDHKKFIGHDEALAQDLVTDDLSYSDHLEAAELENRIKSALNKLPEKCREIFELSRFEAKKYTEISEYLQISVKTVETQMSKALHILKAELKDYLMIFFIIFIKMMNHS
jgi:RNA polymerase sigma-70 factor, ECF subfamily